VRDKLEAAGGREAALVDGSAAAHPEAPRDGRPLSWRSAGEGMKKSHEARPAYLQALVEEMKARASAPTMSFLKSRTRRRGARSRRRRKAGVRYFLPAGCCR